MPRRRSTFYVGGGKSKADIITVWEFKAMPLQVLNNLFEYEMCNEIDCYLHFYRDPSLTNSKKSVMVSFNPVCMHCRENKYPLLVSQELGLFSNQTEKVPAFVEF